MPVQKIDPKVIFASDAPSTDKPPVFNDKTKGWDEARSNDGRPTIKQMNKLQQDTDLKILWLNENSVTPYDESIDYPEGSVTLKDGLFKIFESGVWVEFLDKSSIGLGNVDNTSDLNKPISTATQTALDTKADLDPVKRGVGNVYDSSLSYNINDRVLLDDGTEVISTIANNTNDPNVNMTGWVNTETHNSLSGRDTIDSHPASAISLNQNGSVQNSLHNRLHIAQFGGVCDGISDDSDALQSVINDAQDLANSLIDIYNGMRTPVSIVISGSVLIKKTINIRGDLVRICGENGASIIVDKNGVYTNNYAFNVSGQSSFASYSAHTGALFKDILFKSVDKVVDLFYTGSSEATGGNGGVELKNIVRCSFFGFRRIFSNGISGWGWSWLQCQACLCDTWLYCNPAADTGERQTFTGCIWQNGGYAFTFAGGFTPVYWHSGSFDYCLGIIDETIEAGVNGAVFLDSHFEWIADATYTPCIRLQSSGIRVILSGNMTLGNSSTNMYYIFQQVANNQIKFDNLLLAGGAGWSDYISLDNAYSVDTHGVILPSDSDGSVLAASKCAQLSTIDVVNVKTFAEVTLENTLEHKYVFSASGLVFSSTGGAGANGLAHIDIPLGSQISTIFGLMSVLNNSVGSIGFAYSILDKNKSQVYQITDYAQNSVSKSAITQSVPIGIRKGMSFGASYLRISINLFNVSSTDNLTISQIKLFMQ